MESLQHPASTHTDATSGILDDRDATISSLPAPSSAQILKDQRVKGIRDTERPAAQFQPLSIERQRKTGSLVDTELREISGMSASKRYPGLLYAINDSGNAPRLYAINETGQLIHQWNVDTENRDWEDMTRIQLANQHYVVIGDTGDNLKTRKHAQLHFLAEPDIPPVSDSLKPQHTVTFQFDDGPRNIEAFAAHGSSLYLLSKEPVGAAGRVPSGVYQLDLPEALSSLPDSILTARRVATMPLRPAGLEARLAASVAGVDLSHPTAMAFDIAGNTAYVLTYREVLSITKQQDQDWAEAFSLPAKRVTAHKLAQAEALAVSAGRAIWYTSENVGAPLWAIPLASPL